MQRTQSEYDGIMAFIWAVVSVTIVAAVRYPYIAASIAAAALISHFLRLPEGAQYLVYGALFVSGAWFTNYYRYYRQWKQQTNQLASGQETVVQQAAQPQQANKKSIHRSVDEIWAEIDSLTGLAEVKEALHEIAAVVQADRERRKQGLPPMKQSLHMVFLGNPGTGKTTVARLVGELFASMGVLPSGHMVETDRSGLVAGYIGQTALKTQEKIRQAMGGVLFVDEAYSLARGSDDKDFGREAVDVLVKAMEDHRDRLCIIFAGYTKEMQELFKANSGLESRIAFTITFPDYTPEELVEIARLYAKKRGWNLGPGVEEALLGRFKAVSDIGKAGNGRYARNVIEQMERKAAVRISRKQGPVDVLTIGDFKQGG